MRQRFYYRAYVGAADEQGEPNVGIVVPILNIHAYVLGARSPWRCRRGSP